MLIGIDMIGVQSPDSGDRLAGRYARQLAAALLERDPANRYVLYLHEGMATDRIPARKDVPRVVLAPVAAAHGPARRRLAIQKLIDRNPDGLDWLILLDPFEAHYGGPPPEAPVSGLKVASVVVNMSAEAVGDPDLRLLGRHDLVLAVSDPVAAAGRQRFGGASVRVRSIEPATIPIREAEHGREPMTRVDAEEFGKLGIRGQFVLADASSGLNRRDLTGLLDAYAELPIEVRAGHQLVLVGPLDDPGTVRRRLHDRGCDDGLLLIGAVTEPVIEALYDRCSAYLSPTLGRDAPLALVEALGRGAAIVAGNSLCEETILGDAGLLSDPADPMAVADCLANLLDDPSMARDLRSRALRRASDFPWDTAVESILSALGEIPPAELGRYRVHRAHVVRPRIAYFPRVLADSGRRIDLGDVVPAGLGQAYNIDLYLDATDQDRVVGLPAEFGGFDARLFDRNDAVLDYHAVAYEVADADDVTRLLPLLRRRPGLVALVGEAWFDLEDARIRRAIDSVPRAGSHLIVPCPWLSSRIRTALPEHAGRLTTIPRTSGQDETESDARARARQLLDISPDAFVIGRVREGRSDGLSLSIAHAFKDLARTNRDVMLLMIEAGTGHDDRDLRAMLDRLNVGHRVISAHAEDRGAFAALAPACDVAIHQGAQDSTPLHLLLRSDIPTIVFGTDTMVPGDVVRRVDPDAPGPGLVATLRELALDPDARASLIHASRNYFLGGTETRPAAMLWAEEIGRFAADMPRASGRRRGPEASREAPTSPHFPARRRRRRRRPHGRGDAHVPLDREEGEQGPLGDVGPHPSPVAS